MKTKLRRWLLFLPLSIISTVLGFFIWELLDAFSIGRIISINSFIYRIYHTPLSGMIIGFVFIYTGGYIAPSSIVKTILLGILIMTASLFFSIQLFVHANYWQSLLDIFMIVGGFMGYNFSNKKKHLKS